MTTAYQEQFVTRGDPFKPGVLTLEAKDADDFDVDVPVSAFTNLLCTVRKKPAAAQSDDTDADVVAQVSLVPSAQGAISLVTSNQVQILINGSVTRDWTQGEYFYDVQGHLVADGQPHTVVKGRILVGWAATQTP